MSRDDDVGKVYVGGVLGLEDQVRPEAQRSVDELARQGSCFDSISRGLLGSLAGSGSPVRSGSTLRCCCCAPWEELPAGGRLSPAPPEGAEELPPKASLPSTSRST